MANGFGSLIMDQSPDEEAMMPETFRSPLGKVAVGLPAVAAKNLLWDLPKSLITAAQDNPLPGLRREDYTDIPDAPQPGAELVDRSADAAMNALGTAAPFAKPGAIGALGGKSKFRDWNAAVEGDVAPTAPAPSITAYHGSPHDFDAFDLSKIGTGEGAQAYGHGLYFAENEGVARNYRDALAGKSQLKTDDGIIDVSDIKDPARRIAANAIKDSASPEHARSLVQSFARVNKEYGPAALQEFEKLQGINARPNPGNMYQVDINADPAHFLDWDKPLSEQPEIVKKLHGGLPEQEYATKYGQAIHAMGGDPDAARAAILDLTHNPGSVSNEASWKTLTEGPQPSGFDLNDIHDKLRPTYFDRVEDGYAPRTGRDIEGGVRDPHATQELLAKGIPGIKYLDQGSRGAGEGSQNYVVFNDKLISIVKKYAAAGIALPPTIAAQYAQMQKTGAAPDSVDNHWHDVMSGPQHFAGMLGEDDGKDPTAGAFTQYPGFRQSVDVEDRRNETPASRESTKFPAVPDTEDLSTTALASDLGINDIERAALNEKFKRAVSQAQGSKAKK